MRVLRDTLRRFTRAWALPFLVVIAAAGPARAQDLHPDIPTHAHYGTTDQGWSCNEGFRQVAGFCVADTDPPPSQNAFEVFDGQWRCLTGYVRTNGVCAPPVAPEHASLVGTGGRWECDWGFRKVAARCDEINPPAHGYLDAAGRDWACFPHFERVAEQCVRKPDTEIAPAGPPAAPDKLETTPDPPPS